MPTALSSGRKTFCDDRSASAADHDLRKCYVRHWIKHFTMPTASSSGRKTFCHDSILMYRCRYDNTTMVRTGTIDQVAGGGHSQIAKRYPLASKRRTDIILSKHHESALRFSSTVKICKYRRRDLYKAVYRGATKDLAL